jgi:hypothetical protein
MKVMFAYVPKVACSNWKGIMRSLNDAEDYLNTVLAHDKSLSGLEYLSNLVNPEKLLTETGYKKYAFVRSPYSRVLSAYLNKVESRIGAEASSADHFYKVFQDINTYRAENFDVGINPVVNFYIFLHWLKNSGSIYTFDEHWKPQSDLLDIKNVKFDRIGKFENLSSEAGDFITLLGAKVEFPSQKQIKFAPTGAVNKIEKYYDKDCYELVNLIYGDDFYFFDYPMHLDVVKPKVTFFNRLGRKSKLVEFDVGEYIVNSPIELDSFDVLKGKGKSQTILKVVGSFEGPFIRTKRLAENIKDANWFYEEGVPVRFSIKDLTIDLSDWKPKKQSKKFPFTYGDLSVAGIGLYGKAFEIYNVLVMNVIGSGLISICSAKGGKKDFYLDSPEAKIDGLEVINTKDHSVVFAGPHDSIIRELVVSHSKKKGVYIIADKQFSGSCDIDFIHAYATDDVAIDIQAKVKARLLQGDTGRGAGVVLGSSERSIIDTIESFKTRGGLNDYSVRIECSEAQVTTVRIRADAGASGLSIKGFGNSIDNLHITTEVINSDFKHLNIKYEGQPLAIAGNQNTISNGRIITSNLNPIICSSNSGVRRFRGNFVVSSNINFNSNYNVEPKNFTLSNIKIDTY